MGETAKDIAAAIGLLLLWVFDFAVHLAIPAIVLVGFLLILRNLLGM